MITFKEYIQLSESKWWGSQSNHLRDHPSNKHVRSHGEGPLGFVDSETGEHLAPAPHAPEIADIPPKRETVKATEAPKLKQHVSPPRGYNPGRDGSWNDPWD